MAALSTRDPEGIARRLAEKEHGDHRRKNGSATVEHLRRVSEQVSGEDKIVAWLHDTLEDTGIDPVVIEHLFGPDLYADISLLTHDTTRYTYAQYIDLIAGTGSDRAIRVKLADLNDNLDARGLTLEDESWYAALRRRYIKAQAVLMAEQERRAAMMEKVG